MTMPLRQPDRAGRGCRKFSFSSKVGTLAHHRLQHFSRPSGGRPLKAPIALSEKLPFPVHTKVILTRDGVVLSFVPSFHSIQPCELL
jgi:hypothetical protein